MPAELLRFGVVTDCQYADIPTPAKSKRYYRLSPAKLTEAVAAFNAMGDLDFTVHLGDMIDQHFTSFSKVMPIFRQLRMPRYQCLGNHDFSLLDGEKNEVLKQLEMPAAYYAWEAKGWKCLMLDGNDISTFAHGKTHPTTLLAKRWQASRHPKLPDYNGALGTAQLEWVRSQLDDAKSAGQPVLIFGHYPVLPADSHVLWNAAELVDLVSEYAGVIKGCFCGHNHEGNYAARFGVPFLNFHGMVDTLTNAYARVEASADQLTVTGFGREPDRHLAYPLADFLPEEKERAKH
jgi:manganese-dependent ADP-ribose/CDP-alcohol diphosphatase